MLRKAVTRVALTLAAAVLFVTGSVTNAHAQGTTGKIQGRVTSNGQPVAGASVTIVGTGLGNVTDSQGLYFINEIPAGLVTVHFQALGYRAVDVTGQRITGGNTTNINQALEPSAVEIEAIQVRGDRTALVPRDQVSSRSIVTGETIDKLPFDNAASIIRLQPGVISTNRGSGISIRGSREGAEAVFVDGVPIRNLQDGSTATLELPTNGLAQVDVTTGGISARFGGAQSGVINYVTRTGGTKWGGSATYQTDELSPKKLRFGFNRAEFSIGGPIPFLSNLSYFGAFTAEGNKYGSNSSLQDVYFPQYVPVGIDTIIRLPRSNASGATGCSSGVGATCDSVDIVVPNFVDFDNGPATPGSQSDEFVMNNKLSYGLGRGSKLDFSYVINRNQSLGYGVANGEGNSGSIGTTNVFILGGYFLLSQSADHQIALDLKASRQLDYNQSGTVDIAYLRDHRYAPFGFNVSNVDFIVDDLHKKYPVNETQVNARRSNLIPPNQDVLFLNYGGMTSRSGAEGLPNNVRLDAYGRTVTNQGLGNPTQSWSTSQRWYYQGSVDYQMTRYNRVQFGGDLTTEDDKAMNIPTTAGSSSASHYTPKFGGLFLQDRLDIGDVVLDAGVRMDYSDPNTYFSRIPGYVYNVPDSLTKDKYTLASGAGDYLSRIVQKGDCGGAATAAKRTNSAGQVVCKDNFIPTQVRKTFSPKLAVSFPVTTNSTFRLSYGQNTQVPSLSRLTSGQLSDLGGGSNTNTTYGRDVEIPRTVLFEAGYRQLFGGSTVLDIAAYSKTDRNALSFRKIQFENPNTGASIFINALINADYSLARGADVKLDKRISDVADLSVSYSYVDVRGTGSDPNTYTSIFARNTSNISITTGQPVAAVDVLLPQDNSRPHNVASTLTMQLPGDYMASNSVVHAILADVGVFATARVSSGLPYTRLVNDGVGATGPPTSAGQGSILAEALNSSSTPIFKSFDLRVTKGFTIAGKSLRAFADARNPLNLSNTGSVWTETGQITNTKYEEIQINNSLISVNLDGDILVDDFDIRTENNESAVNKYVLLQAEKRFGNGDGIFTVAEQRALYGNLYQQGNGPQRFKTSIQNLRFGLEFNF